MNFKGRYYIRFFYIIKDYIKETYKLNKDLICSKYKGILNSNLI